MLSPAAPTRRRRFDRGIRSPDTARSSEGKLFRLAAIADIAAARGDYRGAIAGERAMRSIWGCPNCGLFEIAAAFAKLGQADSARYYYEQLLSHKGAYVSTMTPRARR